MIFEIILTFAIVYALHLVLIDRTRVLAMRARTALAVQLAVCAFIVVWWWWYYRR